MGLWSRFWSVVPKAVAKSARDAVSQPDAAPAASVAESDSIQTDGDEIAPSDEVEESVAPEVTETEPTPVSEPQMESPTPPKPTRDSPF